MKLGRDTHHQYGFTLIELMIVVVIIGILSAIAYPAYRSYSLKGKRTKAISALADMAGEQEKFYAENLRYASTITSFPSYATSTDPFITDGGYYSVGVTGSATGYTITATAQGTQLADSVCRTLTINGTGSKTSTDDGGGDTSTICWK